MKDMKHKTYNLGNYLHIPQIGALSAEEMFDIEVVGRVFPFKTNNYVVDELIDWGDVHRDPIFRLNFPQKGMLKPHHYRQIASLIRSGADSGTIRGAADSIRMQLNPHPAGQMELNVPTLNGQRLRGIQRKYRETVLFFPSQGQTCHAYCSFCFRWPQFAGIEDMRFATRNVEELIAYVREHQDIWGILITGGDPLVMKSRILTHYIDSILEADIPHLRTIRIGTKALSYWPYRFLTDDDADELLKAFRKVEDSGRHLALMAHINHPRELSTDAVKRAIARIRETGAEIRTQSPILRHINDDPAIWAEMIGAQVKLSCIPYYMFVVRDTGAQHYFGVPLVEAADIFREAYKKISGLGRTIRGPSMSAGPGKIEVLGVAEIRGEKVMALRMIQGRNPDWALRPFFAEYDETAIWIDELRPAFGEERFFFEEHYGGYSEPESPEEAVDLV